VCGAPPIHCDAHHVVSWLDGGITAVSNLALLCKRDHRDLHSGHWRIRILDGVVQVTHPTWANPTAIPPGKYKPPTADIVHNRPPHAPTRGPTTTTHQARTTHRHPHLPARRNLRPSIRGEAKQLTSADVPTECPCTGAACADR